MTTELNTKQMSVAEIKDYIVANHGIDKTQVEAIKGKTNLVNFLHSLNKVENSEQNKTEEAPFDGPENMLDNDDEVGFVFNIPESQKEEVSQNTTPPQITDPSWTDYVLSQLTDKEKDNDYPKADGLRRLVESLISPITNIETTVIQPPQKDNFMTATVKTRIYLKNGSSYEACTDVQKEHLPSPYDKHISAVAETRAEGRAYRKILRLQNVVTKEEMVSENDHDDSEGMNKTQMAFLDIMCKNDRLNINVKKLFHKIYPDKKLENIKSYRYNETTKLYDILSGYQDNMDNIPSDIRGYDPSWRD